MKRLPIRSIRDPVLRRQAEQLDRLTGREDGAIDAAEVHHALATSRTVDDLRDNPELGRSLRAMQKLIARDGEHAPAPRGRAAALSPLGVQLLSLTPAASASCRYLAEGEWESRLAHRFDVPRAERVMGEGQRVMVPLEARELHVIEMQFRDQRKLAEQRFRFKEPGDTKWRPFWGEDWFAMKKREAKGEIEILRESAYDAPVITNPMFVEIAIVMPDGERYFVGNKRIEFHVHAMKHKNQRGYVELDVVNRATERLPDGALPKGCALELTIGYEHRHEFHEPGGAHAEVQWVKPTYVPEHATRTVVHEAADFEPIARDGYAVEKGRPISAVAVEWSDDISDAEGQLSFASDDGPYRSDLRWVSSGETELFDARGLESTDGRLHIGGKKADELKVRRVEVFYE
jgi:hypothetical protein